MYIRRRDPSAHRPELTFSIHQIPRSVLLDILEMAEWGIQVEEGTHAGDPYGEPDYSNLKEIIKRCKKYAKQKQKPTKRKSEKIPDSLLQNDSSNV